MFVLKSVDSNFLMECGKNASSFSDDLVKNAGLALIGTVHLQVQDSGSSKPYASPISQVTTAEEPVKEVRKPISASIVKSKKLSFHWKYVFLRSLEMIFFFLPLH